MYRIAPHRAANLHESTHWLQFATTCTSKHNLGTTKRPAHCGQRSVTQVAGFNMIGSVARATVPELVRCELIHTIYISRNDLLTYTDWLNNVRVAFDTLMEHRDARHCVFGAGRRRMHAHKQAYVEINRQRHQRRNAAFVSRSMIRNRCKHLTQEIMLPSARSAVFLQFVKLNKA